MNLTLFTVLVIFLVKFSEQMLNYRVIDWEEFTTNESYIVIDFATTFDERIFRVKGRSTRIIDAVYVRFIYFTFSIPFSYDFIISKKNFNSFPG